FSSYTYHSLGENNFLRITSGVIEAKNVNLTVTVQGVGKITESVIANGTARMSITKQGIQCLNSTDGFFSIHFSDPRQDFGFRQWTKQNICLRKLATEHLVCNKNCALIDFVDSTITSNGLTDFQRKWLLKQPSHEFHRFFASFDTTAQVIMDFSRDGITYDFQLSCNNCHTHPNNYYSIYSLNNNTYAWADPAIDKSSRSVLRNYRVLGKEVTLSINEEELHYQNNENSITILPPSSQKIFQLIKDITSTTPVYLSIPFLIAIPLLSPRLRKLLKHSKKAQLTIFFILGIFILIAGSILIGVASIHPIKDYQTTDTQSLVNSCLSDALKDTLLLTGRQGGSIPLAEPSIQDLSAPIITTAITQEQLLNSMQAPLIQAFESCMIQAKPRNVQVCSGTKTAQFILTQDAITAKLQHCYETRARTITKTSEATSTIITNAKIALINEQVIAERALEINEQKPINLDQLQGIITFFPYNKKLISTQQLRIDNKGAWWVYGI
ncbi:MAG: hypothetical protein Q7K43_04480, partial [Candidatus Woesearchaeota archaeon]|nr:hypothetical protein [Candidatus Woesearchaeota archaeon]